MKTMKYLTLLDSFSDRFLKLLLKNQRKYADNIAKILATGQTVTPKTLQWRLKKAKEVMAEMQKDILPLYRKGQLEAFKTILIESAKDIQESPNFKAVPWKQTRILADTGVKFMKNYTLDVQKRLISRLYIAQLNGEGYSAVYDEIKPWLRGNKRSRPSIVVRDQMARIAQEAIVASYGASGHPQDYEYWWTGPDDLRTSEICKERKRKNPYTWEQVKKMNAHPHIQCRHRWTAKPKEM